MIRSGHRGQLCFLGLGSNLKRPLHTLRLAVTAIGSFPATRLCAVSSPVLSAPIGPGCQAKYINAVLCVQTHIPAPQLLTRLQGIENQHGRKRRVRWGPRTLDIDILLYGRKSWNSPALTIPHPLLHEREFVTRPLASIATRIELPAGLENQLLEKNKTSNTLLRLNNGLVWPIIADILARKQQ